MCDFSLMHAKSRPAQVGDKLVTRNFGTGTTGFADVNDRNTAVCLLPGTEIAFEESAIRQTLADKIFGKKRFAKVAIFRQINKDRMHVHHDALEYPGGEIVLLTSHSVDKCAVVLQLPAGKIEPRMQIKEGAYESVGTD